MQGEILIMVNRGGWGDGGLERAREEQAVVEGMFHVLQSQGWHCELKAHERLHSPTLRKYVQAFFDLLLGYKQASRILAQQLQAVLQASPGRCILLVGYSLGAILNISTMQRLPHEQRLYSIELGTPFFVHSLSGEQILRLQKPDDVFSSGPLRSFLFVMLQALLVLAANIGTLQGTSILDAWHMKGHDYAWDNPSVRDPIEKFLRSRFVQKEE